MIIRNCAGGLVFTGDKVLLIRNDKHEWSFPKGVVAQGASVKASAVSRIEVETGVVSKILAIKGIADMVRGTMEAVVLQSLKRQGRITRPELRNAVSSLLRRPSI